MPADASGEPRFLLPGQQAAAAVHALVWVEALDRLGRDTAWDGVARLVVDPAVWQPNMTLVLADGREVAGQRLYAPASEPLWNRVHPLDVTFNLPPAGEEPAPAGGRGGERESPWCFKVWEASFPDNRAPLCLPPSSAALCRRLAPPATATPDRPALWSVLIPFRSMGTPWDTHVARSVARLQHHLAYLQEVGAAGSLLYTDALTRQALERSPQVQRFLREGRLLFVTWDMMERRTYQWDHHLVYGHALLGLAGCGTNLWLQLTDLDEMLFSVYGSTWPRMYSCLTESAGSGRGGAAQSSAPAAAPAAVFRMQRVDVLSSAVDPEAEAALWYSTADHPHAAAAATTTAAAAGATGAASATTVRPPPHPLDLYDRIAKTPLSTGKMVACPAARVVDAWVHDARAVLGSRHEGNASCAFLLHVKNYWRPRASLLNSSSSVYEPIRLLAFRTMAARAARSSRSSRGGRQVAQVAQVGAQDGRG
ncbi:hypothetical protein HYH02_005251 [Chlamydomonas schloesseri]|uniref:Glycosyltransferase family 92 protein n=1 Tax=Chlamydomonas schloesseri TaxID=2026947 RepID=A0A836B7S4_9CHLO|nr:hypothetical protein HYH02_005251 [Chlamydomonas schloesseri]|eukprot:KAG2449724.1 hypothetical protein HYH02_005251 [Chlamydomonas schloesseri]